MEDIAALTLKIDSLQATAAAESLDKLDASGKRVAQTAERFTADLKRQAETLGMSRSQMMLYDAQQMKLNATQLLSVQNSIKSIAAYEGHTAKVDVLGAAMTRLAAILGPAVVLHAFTEAAEHAVHLQSEYVRLSEIAGTTASIMSGFDLPARLAGASMESVAASIAKLSKEIGNARLNQSGDNANMLKALGISANDGRDAAEVYVDLAKSLLGMKDQTVASAISMQFLGRGFAEMRPVLKEIVEQGGIHARVTDEQAESAKRLEDAFVRLKFQGETTKLEIVNGVIPALEQIGIVMNKSSGEASNFTPVGEAVGQVLKTITSYGMAAGEMFYQLSRGLKGMGEVASAVAHGDFDKIKDIWKGVAEDIDAHMIKTKDNITQLFDGRAKAAVEAAKAAQKAEAEAAAAGGSNSGAEARIRQLLYDRLHYEERINLLKAAGQKFADEIKLENQLAEEAYKTAGISNLATQEELMRKQADNNRRNLEQQVEYLKQQRALSVQQGNLGKAAEATGAIEQINAQIVANEAITQAQIRTLRAETGRKLQDELGADRDLEQRTYDLKLKALEAYLAAVDDRVTNANALREKLELTHQAELGNIFAQGKLRRLQFDEMTTKQQQDIVLNSMNALVTSAGAHNKTMFEISKVAAIANAVMSGQEAVLNSYKWGTRIGGPILGGVLAAVAAAAVAININAIRSTTYSGGGTVSVGGASSGAASGASTAFPTSSSPSSSTGSTQGSQIIVNVKVDGNVIGNQSFVDDVLLPAIKDAVDNRDFILIGDNSRQAANLQA